MTNKGDAFWAHVGTSHPISPNHASGVVGVVADYIGAGPWLKVNVATVPAGQSAFPGIRFTVHHVIVQGWPWNTLVATRLSVAAPRADGSVYRNEAMQFLRLRWGKVVEDHLYEDTYKLADELQQRLSHEEIISIH